jgi:D-glycero-D-manno-heptose 1,7-bisphosphate phosphatase
MATPIIVLDRDGVVIIDKHYLHKPEDIEFPPEAIEGLQLLQRTGMRMVLVTGQAAIGRGKYPEADMHIVHGRLCELLKAQGILFSTIAWCPHDPSANCECRKPGIGMLLDVENRLSNDSIDWTNSWGIGDKPVDSEMMLKMGGSALLLESEYWDKDKKVDDKDKDISSMLANPRHHIAENLLEAAVIIRHNLE